MFIICYICNKTANEWCKNFPKRRLKSSKLTISDIIKRIVRNVTVQRDIDAESNCLCMQCLKDIQEYDSMCVSLEQKEKNLRKLILATNKTWTSNGQNRNEQVDEDLPTSTNEDVSNLDDELLACEDVTTFNTMVEFTDFLVKVEEFDDIEPIKNVPTTESKEITEDTSNHDTIISETRLVKEEFIETVEIITKIEQDEITDCFDEQPGNSNSLETETNGPDNPKRSRRSKQMTRIGEFECEICDLDFHERKLFKVIWFNFIVCDRNFSIFPKEATFCLTMC